MIRMTVRVATVVAIAHMATVSGGAALAAEPVASGATMLPEKSRQLEVVAVDGVRVRPLDVRGEKASVIVFVLQDCPISNKYAPEIQRLADEFGKKGARFYVVHVDPELGDRDAAKHAEEHKYKLPLIVDRQHDLVRALRATIAPEAFVIGNEGKVVYRGRIDDRYVALGKPRHEVQRRDLRRALEAVIEGRQVEVAKTKAVGCFIPELD